MANEVALKCLMTCNSNMYFIKFLSTGMVVPMYADIYNYTITKKNPSGTFDLTLDGRVYSERILVAIMTCAEWQKIVDTSNSLAAKKCPHHTTEICFCDNTVFGTVLATYKFLMENAVGSANLMVDAFLVSAAVCICKKRDLFASLYHDYEVKCLECPEPHIEYLSTQALQCHRIISTIIGSELIPQRYCGETLELPRNMKINISKYNRGYIAKLRPGFGKMGAFGEEAATIIAAACVLQIGPQVSFLDVLANGITE